MRKRGGFRELGKIGRAHASILALELLAACSIPVIGPTAIAEFGRIAELPGAANLFVPSKFSSNELVGQIDEVPGYLVTYSTGDYNITIRVGDTSPESLYGRNAQLIRLKAHSQGTATLDTHGSGLLLLARADLTDHGRFVGSIEGSDSFLLSTPYKFTVIRVYVEDVARLSILNHDFSEAYYGEVANTNVEVTLRGNVFEAFVIVIEVVRGTSVSIVFGEGSSPAPDWGPFGLVVLVVVVVGVAVFVNSWHSRRRVRPGRPRNRRRNR